MVGGREGGREGGRYQMILSMWNTVKESGVRNQLTGIAAAISESKARYGLTTMVSWNKDVRTVEVGRKEWRRKRSKMRRR